MKMKQSFLLLAFCLIANHLFSQQWPGYTLYSVGNSSAAYLVDTNGTSTHNWTFATSAKTGYSTHMMPGGILWRSISRSGNSFTGGGMTGEIQVTDYNGTVLWDFVYSSTTYCIHHDHCPLPNGNVLLISYESKTATEVSAAGCAQNIVMWPEKIIEVQPTGPTTGTIVWEWHVWDHLVQNADMSKPNYQTSIVDHPELLNINYNTQKDWMHMNGIDYNPVLDQIVVSSHNLNEWYVIDHSTTTAEAATHTGGLAGHGGDFLYRWGNPAAYGATGTRILNVTHDSHWIPEGTPHAGDLVGFNNKGVSNSQSSIDRITPPRVGYNYTHTAGMAFTPASYDGRLACNGYSSNMGSSDQLPNGNQLVCIATAGNIYEADSNGTTLWTKTVSGSTAQSHRYSDCYVNYPAPTIPEINESGDTLYSTSGVFYQWYMNGDPITGATESFYVPSQDGAYLVRITDSNGCVYSYSLTHRFVALQSSVSGIRQQLNMSIFPNPSDGIFRISITQSVKTYTIDVYNSVGQKVFTGTNTESIDLSSAPKGIYTAVVNAPDHISLIKKIIITE
jgi:hypothetical protein